MVARIKFNLATRQWVLKKDRNVTGGGPKPQDSDPCCLGDVWGTLHHVAESPAQDWIALLNPLMKFYSRNLLYLSNNYNL
ncbi:hypothetical protein XENTR_v10023833 [Xenopus tropicalis]|nr:hypothetical protein XENTR_v10023833 [Xenopus tropicalis]